METCARVIEILDYGYKNAPYQQLEQWIRWCAHYIKLYTKVLKRVVLSTGERNKIQAQVALIQYYHERFKDKRRRGGRLHSSSLRRGTRRDRIRWMDSQSVFRGRISSGTIVNLRHTDLEKFLRNAQKLTNSRIKHILGNEGNIKVNSILACKFQMKKSEIISEETKYFNTRNEIILPSTDLEIWFQEKVIDRLLEKVEDFQEGDSGWTLTEIINLVICVNHYIPLSAGLSIYVELPYDIQRKKSVVNVKNIDEFCFLWSVVAALFPAQSNKCIISSYPHYAAARLPHTNKKLEYKDLCFPLALNDVPKFEKKNGLSINVYGIEDGDGGGSQIVPFHLSKVDSKRPTIHLLFFCSSVHDDAATQPIYHFAWIRDLSRLVSAQISRHAHRTWLCDRCLCHFQEERCYRNHKQDCFIMSKCKSLLPNEGENILRFKNHRFKEVMPFVIYADLECSDCIKWFIKRLQSIGVVVNDYLNTIIPMEELSDEKMRDFVKAQVCHICTKSFTPTDAKHRDHCHITGKYRGAAHIGCNLNYKNSHDIPVIFHNLSGYDEHFLIRDLAKEFNGSVELLPINKEKYIAFRKHIPKTKVYLRFIDPFRFIASSLEKLASYLSISDLKITQAQCDNNDEKLGLLMRKGVFPYEYVDSWEKLVEEDLPSGEDFYSKLNNQQISEKDYEHARQVWTTFNVSTLGEYSDLYLKTDVLLLSDVFESFRKNCYSVYKLDTLHYYTAPGLAFDAMLKDTNAEIEIFTDIEKLLFIEKGIRGGVAQCTNRYAHANNRYMNEQFDSSKEESYLMYYDINNLYGAAMSEYLPYGSFEWENPEAFNVFNVSDHSPIGYILEVDLEYPLELHNLHKDLPLYPEHFVPSNRKNSKLITTLFPKKEYIIHYRNLKQCLNLGMKLTKIHRLLKFKQEAWLKPYIDLNTEMQKKSTNEFEKNFFKLMNNAVFGKTMENVRKQKDVKLITEWNGRYGARARIAQPNFHSSIIFDDDNDLVIIHLDRVKITFNKPIYIGFAILDLSKTIIYNFHYNYVKQVFGDDSKLMYTDTDSLLYYFTVPDIYECIKRDIAKFDTYDYPERNVYGIPRVNKKMVGLMNDECGGKIMTDFIGLRAKLYTFKVMGEVKEKKRAKGVKGSTLRTITFDVYENCHLKQENLVKEQYFIQSKKHNVFTIKQSKLALSSNDDKRILLPGVTDTLPYRYCK
ncbi:uncharacterized protein LOC107040393 [Diachasma alloeum]|uniref:uncharacterized protein LOC107040393 n=1 Tax=Diachasma alloeum TaxID=454923 RepID=UPI00073844CD|nr:uncharacterized protein LOC107040393 [Diachasma alloeum]